MYEKYKEKGFEIFGVSLDDNLKKWGKAVKKDKIGWTQVNDNGGWQGVTATRWNIYQIPTSYLVSRDGKLVVRDPEIEDLEKILSELLD